MSGEVWFNDSAPGNAQPATLLKCGGRKPSLGLSPQTLTIAAPLVDTLADRALVAPGTNPVLSPDPMTRAQQLGFNGTGQMPYFDGQTTLYNLFPNGLANTTSFSISCWVCPDNMNKGAIIRSPALNHVGNPEGGSELYIGAPGMNGAFSGGITPLVGGSEWPKRRAPIALLGASASGTGENEWYLQEGDYTGSFGSQWWHVMIAIRSLSQVNPAFPGPGAGPSACVTVYVNDTAICAADFNMNTANQINSAPPNYGLPLSSLRDGCTPPSFTALLAKIVGPNRWALGAGAYLDGDSGSSEEHDGAIQCVATEWWIAPGHFVDWSDSANRNKFHTLDSTLSNYIPTNIGARGQVMGFVPAIYCTGNAGAFRINRANGKLLSMQGGGADVTFIPHYGEVQNMVSNDRVPGG